MSEPPADAPTVAEQPAWAPFWLACRACGHAWDDWIPVKVPFDTVVAHMRAFHCLKCRADSHQLSVRTTPLPGRGFD